MKNNDQKSKSKTRGKKSTIGAVLVIAALFSVLIYLTYAFNVVSLFDISSMVKNNNKNNLPFDESDQFYDDLLDESELKGFETIYKVTPDELTAVISSFKTCDKYELEAQIISYGSAATRVVNVNATRDGDVFKVDKYVDNTYSESIVSDGDYITYTDKLRSRSTKHSLGDGFDFESCCNIPSISDLKEICKSVLNGDDTVIDYEISLVSSENKSFYMAVFTYPDIMQREEYYISVETEMIVNAYSYINDNLYYRYSLTSYRTS